MAGEAGGVGQQRREPLHPPVDGDVIDLHATFHQQFLDVAVDKLNRKHQRIATTMTSGGNRNPANADAGDGGQVRGLVN